MALQVRGSKNEKLSFRTALKVELARAELTHAELAMRLGVAPTTLSTWLRAAHPAPADLAERIERSLHLRRGTLAFCDGGTP